MLALLFVISVLIVCGQRSFIIQNDEFVKDGQVFHIYAGEYHYFRIHPNYWADRMLRYKALGLNALQIYVPWNFHEEVRGSFNFTGWRDLGAVLQLAADNDLLVLVRAGPYICGEWDFGGFPSWLLSIQPPVTLRTYEQGYIAAVDAWWGALLPVIKPYLYENGGPVVMIQVENEYGSYGDVSTNEDDKNYLLHLVDLVRQYLGNNIIPYTTDGGSVSYMQKGTLVSEVYSVGDFGPGSDPLTSFNAQKQFNDPGMSPNMCTEYYTGWLTAWGEAMANTSSASVATWLDKIIQLDGSVSLYMGTGGTNFGFWSGANGQDASFTPDITSYDYDAPISEGGEHGYGPDGDKFVAVRNIFSKYVSDIPAEPAFNAKTAYGTVSLNNRADLFSQSTTLITKLVQSQQTNTMENLGGQYGFIMYSTSIPSATSSNTLAFSNVVRDRCSIFVDTTPVGIIYRTQSQTLSGITASAGQTLNLLVENMGRINYGHGMWDPKGISGNVNWNGNALSNFNISLLPLSWDQVQKLTFSARGSQTSGPAFYRGTLNINGDPTDTYIQLLQWTKGIIWINGNNIGRYWESQGPQHSFYIPKYFLQSGANDIVVFEIEAANDDATVVFIDHSSFYTGQSCVLDRAAVGGENVVAFHCDSAWNTNQQWTLRSNGTITLNSNPSLCLQQGPDNDPQSGYPNIELQPCNGSKQQQFTYSSNEIKSANNGQCLDITGGSTSDGVNIETYPCAGSKNQLWTIDSTSGRITSQSAGQCVSVCPS